MKKKGLLKAISTLFVILFLNAAISNMIDHQSFEDQLAHSPLIMDHASMLSWAIPAFELATILLLIFGITRITGLIAALKLMILYSAYSCLMLRCNQQVCGCIGILKGVSWKEHLFFCSCLMLIAGIGTAVQLKAFKPPNERANVG